MKLNTGYSSKEGNTFGLFPRFFWDVRDVPFGGQPNMKREQVGFLAETAVMRREPIRGGRFSKVKRATCADD